MTIITLTTDFGLKDGNVGVMKGVIWGIAPHVRLVDLSHTIAPQDVAEAAWVLKRAAPYFPAGTIHVAVIDPGVGTARRPLAAWIGQQRFVGPDNGVFTRVLLAAEQAGAPVTCVVLDRPEYWRPSISHVFHGRDIFAPAAAHLAADVPLEELGTPLDDPVRLPLAAPVRQAGGLTGVVTHVDHFGNIATNITRADLGDRTTLTVHIGGVDVPGLLRTFGEAAPGTLIALYSSTDDLLVAEVNGNAARRLGVRPGDEIILSFELPGPNSKLKTH
jgi:S-adenosylmethionine hydrolase